ncbi:hypothetical protein BDV33DRAFT_31860 [Aspergillus novoparasiticus]|uniref:Uncharacterized protein n=1 Tax=Aspergillus novoparasiticus TaxID=986946 RepID=A0A5N6EB25_9EURO|nr:hypothetical protein BDV33DRAFT_31860 [Aspergillus novoparasiticus]
MPLVEPPLLLQRIWVNVHIHTYILLYVVVSLLSYEYPYGLGYNSKVEHQRGVAQEVVRSCKKQNVMYDMITFSMTTCTLPKCRPSSTVYLILVILLFFHLLCNIDGVAKSRVSPQMVARLLIAAGLFIDKTLPGRIETLKMSSTGYIHFRLNCMFALY